MKKLTRMKLINWHRFLNETLSFEKDVLISGENGAGKSTLLDAIQFVITCSGNSFNKAAHDKGKRTLNTYVRSKSGVENHPYEREGEISAHIALEFYEESRKQYFIVGAVMDSASPEKEPSVGWYCMDNCRLTDEMFLRGRTPKNISVFRSTNKNIRQFAITRREARAMMLNRFGRPNEKFFSLIPKALAFRPIPDIKEFVYSYVLDEKDVNIDALRENVRSYRELSEMLKRVRLRIEKLDGIDRLYDSYAAGLKKDRTYDYFIANGRLDEIHGKQTENEKQLRLAGYDLESLIKKKNEADAADKRKDKAYTALLAEIQSNESFRSLDRLKEQEDSLLAHLAEERSEKKQLKESAGRAFSAAEKLRKTEWKFPAAKEIMAPGERSFSAKLAEYQAALEALENISGTAELKILIEDIQKEKNTAYERISRAAAEAEITERKLREDKNELRQRIERLKSRKLTYEPDVTRLKEGIESQFAHSGRSGKPRILCELLNVTDPEWQNAVEGYLNTQRFHLLVEPEDYDLAASAYDKLRGAGKAYGVGLINTGKLEAYDTAPEGSLASVVTSQSIWAKRYINMILGKVVMCRSAAELKKYPVSITRQCMRYQNHVLTAIPPKVFETPYIGAQVYEVQLKQAEEKMAELNRKLEERAGEKKECEHFRTLLAADEDTDIKYKADVILKLRAHEAQLQECRKAQEEIRKNPTLIEKQIRLEELQKERDALRAELEDRQEKIGARRNDINYGETQKAQLLENEKASKAELTLKMKVLGEDCPAAEEDYKKQSQGKTPETFIFNYERTQKANRTVMSDTEGKMKNEMHDYKAAFDFGAAESLAGYPDFLAENEKLKESELLSYEEKVAKAREAAETEFREQFLSRLQENIKQAQGEFRELNRALSEIEFSGDRYEFLYSQSRKREQYYKMIMDDFNILQGESIFSGDFNNRHKAVIEELFEKLSGTDENSESILEEYTDYRAYMDYDIKITNPDGQYMYYSKVSLEKSGGETQTPFYITVAASFIQLYKNSMSEDAIGLVLFDEAFNNMDDERMAGVLDFLRNSGLQVVIAVPPPKIQYIEPYMDEVLLVMQDSNVNYIEEYTHKG